jgi:hypothetical protein
MVPEATALAVSLLVFATIGTAWLAGVVWYLPWPQ